ncbi:LysR family transcriptional regulator [Psychromonas sp. SR45-3]|uniref:LysR family transcriptional regulator n=1 Tax=Psychromonas sp. SR45-3 TaxID=2760930 RepID=UPI0015FDAAD1|nr:LysR family transcriptional regulator [Psychromonas sp. SR45-3]MBB1271487.1 LysR family transcriptional regulator [Psychromonas sp. SR45-3]
MNIDKLMRIDLNLLVVLQVLLEEESVTRAAVRLNLSQSALSKSLNRLRISLQDPLFSRTAHGLKPTAHALQLQQKLPSLLQNLYQLTQAPRFDPSSSDRHFSISMLESAYATLLPYFIGPLLKQASHVHLDILSWMENSMQSLQQGKVDFGITGIDFYDDPRLKTEILPDGIAHTILFHDQQTCLVNENHPVLESIKKGHWDIDSYLQYNHIQVSCEGNKWWAIDYFLEKQGKQRNIISTLPDFYGGASVCAHSDLIFTLPSSFVPHAQKLYPLKQIPLPFSFSEMAYVLLWHQRNSDEPGHKWIREMICNSVANAIDK